VQFYLTGSEKNFTSLKGYHTMKKENDEALNEDV
jgi:hypothetical protein